MCVAIPGRVISIDGMRAQVDFRGNLVAVNIGVVDPKPGDYVLVHAGCAIEVMAEDRAKEIISLFDELEDLEETGQLGA